MLEPSRLRLDAILHVLALRRRWIAVPGSELNRFPSQGQVFALRGPQGIFKPRELDEPLSLLSSLASSYVDEPLEGNRIRYQFLGSSREFDNEGLKRAAELRLPLIYLLQVNGEPEPEYEVFAPVYVIGWDDGARQFVLDLSGRRPDELAREELPPLEGGVQLPLIDPSGAIDRLLEPRGEYGEDSALRRIHRAHFRREVLGVYRQRCAVCGLGIRALLDAAMLGEPDSLDSIPSVQYGICFCIIHLGAWRAGILGYDGDYTVRIRLKSGRRARGGERALLTDFDGAKLHLPRDPSHWPRRADPTVDDATSEEAAAPPEPGSEPPATRKKKR